MNQFSRRTLSAAFATLFYLVALTRMISQVFVLNFSTAGLNSTVLLVLLYPSVVFLVLLQRMGKYPDELTWPHVSLVAALNLLSAVENSVFAVLVSTINLTLLTMILIDLSRFAKEMATGIALGVVAHQTLTNLLYGLNPYSTTITLSFFTVLSAVYIIFTYIGRDHNQSEDGDKLHDRSPSLLYTALPLLVYSTVFAGNSYVIIGWQLRSGIGLSLISGLSPDELPTLTSVLAACSSSLGVLLSLHYRESFSLGKYPLIVLFLATLTNMILLSWLPLLSVLLHFYAMAELLQDAAQNTTDQHHIPAGLAGLQLILLLLMFLQVTSGHWAFLPSAIQPVTKGMAGLYIILLGSTFVLPQLQRRTSE